MGHGLGHRIGLDVHEDPIFSEVGLDIIRAGMVVTVELGIYMPGLGGVRIEDNIILKEKGLKKITNP